MTELQWGELAYRALLVETLMVWGACILWANSKLVLWALVLVMCQHCFVIGYTIGKDANEEELQPLLHCDATRARAVA